MAEIAAIYFGFGLWLFLSASPFIWAAGGRVFMPQRIFLLAAWPLAVTASSILCAVYLARSKEAGELHALSDWLKAKIESRLATWK